MTLTGNSTIAGTLNTSTYAYSVGGNFAITGTATLGGTTTVGGALTVSSGTLSFGTNSIDVSGSLSFTGGTVSGTGTITMKGSGVNLNLTVPDPGALVIDGSVTVTGAATTCVVGAVNINATRSLNVGNYRFQTTGNAVVDGSVTSSNGTTGAFRMPTGGTNTLTVNDGGSVSITSTAMNAVSFASITLNGSGSISSTSGRVRATTGGITINGAGGISTTGGEVLVTAGGLRLNGAGGIGTSGAGPVTVSAGGVAINSSGGIGITGTGILGITGNLSWGAGAGGSVTVASGGMSVAGNASWNATATGGITVSGGGLSLTGTGNIAQSAAANGDILVTGNLSMAGTLTNYNLVQVTSGNLTVSGAGPHTNAAGATIATVTSGTQSYGGAVTNSGTITGVGLVTVSGNLTSGGTLNMGTGGATVTGAANFSGGTVQFAGAGTAAMLTVTGNLTFSAGSTVSNATGIDTITFSGGLAQTLTSGGKTLPSIAESKSGNGVTLQDDVTQAAGATLTFNNNAATSFDLNGHVFTPGANLTINDADTTLTVNGGTYSGGGSYSVTVTAGTVTHGSGALSCTSLTVNGGTYNGSGAGTLTLAGEASVSSGSMQFGGKTVSGITNLSATLSGSFDIGTTTPSISGNLTFTTSSAWGGTGTLTMTDDGTTVDIGAQGAGNLTINAGGTVTVNSAGAGPAVQLLTVSGGTLAVSAASFQAASAAVSAGVTVTTGCAFSTVGALTVNGGGTVTGNGTGAVTVGNALALNGTGAIGVAAGTVTVTLGGLTLNGTGAVSSSGAGALTVSAGGVTWTGTSSSTITLSGTGGLNITGDFTQSSGANGAVTVGSGGVTISGTLSNYDMLQVTGGNLSVSGAGPHTNAAGATIATVTSGTQGYGGAVTNSGTITGIGLMTFGGSLTNGGTLNVGTDGATIVGAASFSGGTLNLAGHAAAFGADLTLGSLSGQSGSTITFNGSSTQTFTTVGQGVGSVTLDNTTAVQPALRLVGNMSMTAASGTLTLTRGQLDANGYTVALGADLTYGNANVPALVLSNGTLAGGARTITVGQGSLDASGTGIVTTTGSFTVNASATVSVGTNTFTVGAMTVGGGSFTQSGVNTGLNTVASLSVTSGSCRWDNPANGGDLTISGDLSQTGGTLNFNSKNVTIGGTVTGNITFMDLVIQAGKTIAMQPSSSLTVLRHFEIEDGGTYVNNSRPLTLGGVGVTIGTITDRNLGTKQDLGAVTMDGGAGTVKRMGSALVMSSLDIGASVTLETGIAPDFFNLTVSGDLTGAGGLTAASAESITVGGDFTVAAFTPASSTVTLNGTYAADVGLAAGYSFTNLTVNKAAAGSTVTPAGTISVTGTLVLTQGTWMAGGTTLVLTNGNWNSSSGTFTFTQDTSTVQLNAAAPTITQKAADHFNNLVLQQGGTVSSALLTVDGALTAAGAGGGGTLNLGGNTVNVGGDLNLKPGTTGASLSAAGSTVNLNGTAMQTLTTNAQTFNDLTILNGTKTVTVAGSLTLSGNLDVQANQTLDLRTNNAVLNVSGNVTDAGTVQTGTANASVTGTTSGTGAWAAGAGLTGTGILTFTGAYTLSGALTASSTTTNFENAVTLGSIFTANGGTVNFQGTVNPQDFNPNGRTLGAMTVNKGGVAQALRLMGALVVSDANLSVTTGTLNFNGYSVTLNNPAIDGRGDFSVTAGTGAIDLSTASSALLLAGDLTVVAGTVTIGSATVTFQGSNTPQVMTSNGNNWYGVTVNKAAGIVQLADDMTQSAGGALTLTSGQLNANGHVVTLGANLSYGNVNAPALVLANGTLAGGTRTITVGQGSLDASGTGIVTTTGSFAVNASATVSVGTSTFTVGAMTVGGGSFTQTGNNVTAPGGPYVQRAASLSVSGGTCTWDSGAAGGSLAVNGTITQSGGTLGFGDKNASATGAMTITAGALDLGSSAISLTTAGSAVSVTPALTLTANGASISTNNGNATFTGAIDGTFSLSVSLGTGKALFSSSLGQTTPIGSLSVTSTNAAADAITLRSVRTSGAQSYTGNVTLGATSTFQGSTVTFGGDVAGATYDLTVTGNAVIGAAVANALTGVGTLSVSSATTVNAGGITTSAGQSFGGDATLGSDTALSAGGAIGFGAAVSGAHTLSLDSGGAISVTGAVGAPTALTSLTVANSTSATFSGNVSLGTLTLTNTTGAITINGNLVATTAMSAAASVFDLALNQGAAGQTSTVAGAVATSLSNSGTLTLGNAAADSITFAAGLTATSQTANAFQGTVATGGAAGQNISLNNLTVGAGGLALSAGSGNVSASGTITVGAANLTATSAQMTAGTLAISAGRTARLVASAVAGVAVTTANVAGPNTAGTDAANPSGTGATNGILDLANSNFSITTLNSTGILRLTGEQTGNHSITNNGATRGIIEYYDGTGAGTVFNDIVTAAPNYYHLRINGSARTFTANGNIETVGDVILDGGVLALGATTMTVGGHWLNAVGSAALSSGSGTVRLVPNAGRFPTSPRVIRVMGDNDWWIFWCHDLALGTQTTILFENAKIQRIRSGGIFSVQGFSAAQHLTLNRLTASGTPTDPPSPILGNSDMWYFDLIPGATFDMLWVEVYFSNAALHPVGTPPNVYTDPFATYHCFKWLNYLFAIYSYTEDSDYNGKIDRIRVTTEAAVDNDFSGFAAAVQGYTVKGYSRPSLGNNFYILLEEGPTLDTGVTPDWHIVTNTSLKDDAFKSQLVGTLSRAGGSSDWMTPADTAWPIIGYTLALPGLGGAVPDTFVHASEALVLADGTSAPTGTDFGFSTAALTQISPTAGAPIREALGNAATVPTLANLADGSNSLAFTAGLRDDQPDPGSPYPIPQTPYWEDEYFNLVSAPPDPTYPPSTGYTADPNSYGNEGSAAPVRIPVKDGGRYISRPTTYNFSLGGGAFPKTTHRVSDVLVSSPPVASPPAGYPAYFVWPIWAKDQIALTISEADIEAATTSESSAAEGIGLIRAFDGSQWLRDQDITLQSRLESSLAATVTGIALDFDSRLPASLVADSGLWLPAFDEENTGSTAGFSGLVPYPDKSPKGRGISTASGLSMGSDLWNFAIPSSDPRIVSVSSLGFFFTLTPAAPASQQPLYVARLDMTAGAALPTDWYRRVRPFSFGIHDVRLQRGSVTILNNVIDPTKGETTRISYQLEDAGSVTITVFTLDGDVVKRLFIGHKPAGDFATSWDGRNGAGLAVARGIYFVRVVAPGVDEIRKVLVVRK